MGTKRTNLERIIRDLNYTYDGMCIQRDTIELVEDSSF